MKHVTRRTIFVLLVACLVSAAGAHAAPPGDWPQFRGPLGSGAADPAAFPAVWDAERMVAWKVDLPGRGPSSPIVVGGRVIVTASSGNRQDQLHVLAFDAKDGRLLWQRQFWATGRTFTHPQTSVAAPTPASDGTRVFAFYSSNDLAALDLDGNLLWYRGLAHDFPRLGNDVGMAASPLVVGERVVVQGDSQGEAFVAGIDVGDGTTRWQIDREKLASWTSPAPLPLPSAPGVLVESPKGVTAIDPANGSVLWDFPVDCDTISSACADGDLVFVPGKSFTALRTGAGVAKPEVAWSNNQLQCGAASPCFFDGKIFAINRGGVLIVASADGAILSRTRMEGTFWGSPVVAGNRVFAVSFDGTAQLVELAADGRSGKIAAKIPLGEQVQGSPAVAQGAIFVRSDGHLWKLAAPAEN